MVHRVELGRFHQPVQVRKLHVHQPAGLESRPQASNEVVDVWHVGQHVVADDEVGLPALCGQALRQGHAEELLKRLHALLARGFGRACRGLYAKGGHPGLAHVLQQVAVVAGNLHHQGVRPKPQARESGLHVGLGVGQPGAGERREVHVLAGEDLRAALHFVHLHQKAVRADKELERIVRLRGVQVLRLEEGVGRRRGSKIQKDLGERRVAKAAVHMISKGAKPWLRSGCARSRSESSATGSGQPMPSSGSSCRRPPSCSGL